MSTSLGHELRSQSIPGSNSSRFMFEPSVDGETITITITVIDTDVVRAPVRKPLRRCGSPYLGAPHPPSARASSALIRRHAAHELPETEKKTSSHVHENTDGHPASSLPKNCRRSARTKNGL
jgi:hypothetical protein